MAAATSAITRQPTVPAQPQRKKCTLGTERPIPFVTLPQRTRPIWDAPQESRRTWTAQSAGHRPHAGTYQPPSSAPGTPHGA
eukprot:1155839-Pelagomonas_calceolata.AAC.14